MCSDGCIIIIVLVMDLQAAICLVAEAFGLAVGSIHAILDTMKNLLDYY